MKYVVLAVLALAACGDDSPKKSVTSVVSNNRANNTSNNGSNNATNNHATNNSSGTNNAANNATNNAANNATNNVVNNANNTNNVVVDEVTLKCRAYCELVLGNCITDNCELSGQAESQRQQSLAACLGTGAQSCDQNYRTNLDFRDEVDGAQGLGCFSQEVELARCYGFGFEACSCPLPSIDAPCTSSASCDGGYLQAQCQPEQANGVPRDGQCIALGCRAGNQPAVGTAVSGDGTGCGSQNVCYVFNTNQTVCLPGCETDGDCRAGYRCLRQGNIGVCEPTCESNDQCQPNRSVCDDDSVCQVACNTNSDCSAIQGQCTGLTSEGQKYCIR